MKTLTIRNVEEIAEALTDVMKLTQETTAAGAIRTAVKRFPRIQKDLENTRLRLAELKEQCEQIQQTVYTFNLMMDEIRKISKR